MKRHRKTTLNKQMALLSATEFASLLNQHDDASAVLSALQRFVFTVKRERRIALGVHHGKYEGGSVDLSADEGGSDLSSSSSDESERDSGDNEEVPMKAASPRKRFKIDEAWKEDSAFYQVPFVGTAVAASKKTDVVVVGEWPTGILQAYLTKSPLAVELISDNLIPSSSSSALHKPLLKQRSSKKEQQKNRRLSQAIHKAYLRALAELVTAAIPMEKWLKKTHAANRTNSRNQEQQTRFISELVTKRLVMLLSVLAEETGHGKGKSGLRGGCGPLAAPLLTIIDRLAMTSTQTARHIARSLEQNLPETVLRFLLSHRPRAHQQQQKGEDESRSLPTETPREKAQIAALNLASTLTEIDDAVVFSCISTAGVKDKKVRPGALFLALQQGLPVQQQHQTDAVVSLRQIQAVTRLFKAVRSLLSRPAVSQRSLIVIFSRECMQHICHISTSWAPPLTNFEVVLSVTDTHDDTEHAVHDTYDMEHAAHATLAKEKAGTEARRLLFPLLADLKRSPFLPSISAATKHNRFYEAAVQRVTRAMVLLLDDRNLEVRRFLLHIPSIAPVLLPAFFRAMPIPDTRQPFAFAARLSCVSAFLRQGPRAADCFSITEIADEGKLRVDSVLLTMLPLGLKKHTFAKALQSTNHFVALEALKLLVVAFGRCRCFLLDLDKRYDKNLVARVSDLLTNELPDLLILLATLAKLDVQRDRKSGVVLFGYACEAVRTCISVFPVKDGKFDWTKLLPGNAMAFHSSPVLVQRMILSSVKVAILSQKVRIRCTTKPLFLFNVVIPHISADSYSRYPFYSLTPTRLSSK